jgi:hypothetical protein
MYTTVARLGSYVDAVIWKRMVYRQSNYERPLIWLFFSRHIFGLGFCHVSCADAVEFTNEPKGKNITIIRSGPRCTVSPIEYPSGQQEANVKCRASTTTLVRLPYLVALQLDGNFLCKYSVHMSTITNTYQFSVSVRKSVQSWN